jgi:hypothetical protein
MFAHFLSPGLNLQFTWADVYGPATAHKRMHTLQTVGKGGGSDGMRRAELCCTRICWVSIDKCGKGFKAMEKE